MLHFLMIRMLIVVMEVAYYDCYFDVVEICVVDSGAVCNNCAFFFQCYEVW